MEYFLLSILTGILLTIVYFFVYFLNWVIIIKIADVVASKKQLHIITAVGLTMSILLELILHTTGVM